LSRLFLLFPQKKFKDQTASLKRKINSSSGLASQETELIQMFSKLAYLFLLTRFCFFPYFSKPPISRQRIRAPQKKMVRSEKGVTRNLQKQVTF
jgi:hypothetical protein